MPYDEESLKKDILKYVTSFLNEKRVEFLERGHKSGHMTEKQILQVGMTLIEFIDFCAKE